LTGLITVALFRWLNTQVLQKELSKEGSFQYQKGPSEIKMSLRKNFSYLANSKYLLCIAIIVITYNIAINLTEVVWKDQVRQLHNDPNLINAYMARVNQWIGVIAMVFALCCGPIIRRFNWTFTAMIPPVILLVAGGAFFSLILFNDLGWSGLAYALGSSPLLFVVMLGSVQNCFSRASKYTFFDTTKELAFIPLSQECKLKGKAAIDGVGSRFGKSGGAVIYQFLLMFCGTIAATIPFVAIALIAVIGAWMFAVKLLGKQFKTLMDQQPPAEPVPVPAAEKATVLEPTPS
jgi:AAA family ATP:ADP antiporter